MVKAVFDTHGNDSELNIRSGEVVQVIRPLTEHEADIDDVGPMFKIRFSDGKETDAFGDELYPISYYNRIIKKLLYGNGGMNMKSRGEITEMIDKLIDKANECKNNDVLYESLCSRIDALLWVIGDRSGGKIDIDEKKSKSCAK